MPKWCTATVVEKQIWTEGLFTISIESNEVLPFQPGQFLHLAVRNSDEKIINRPYSVASPHGKRLEFFIVVVPEGKLTPRLWELEQGSELLVSQKAAGRFSLKHSPPAESLWLFATGTGLAPYIAMLRDPEIWDTYQRIVVAHGVRHAADLAYRDELNRFASENPERFRYVPALTREEHPDTLKGRLPVLLENGQLENSTGFKLAQENSTVLLCGNPAMLDDMVDKLQARGLQEHRKKYPGQIVLERYW